VLDTDDGRQVTATAAAKRWFAQLDPVQRASGTLIYALVARLGAVRALRPGRFGPQPGPLGGRRLD
jgi:hypothetical protein